MDTAPLVRLPRTVPAVLRSAALVLVSLGGGLGLLQGLAQGPSGTTRLVDVAVGVLCSLTLLCSRRAPVPVAVGLALCAGFFATAGVANMLALYVVARRCRLVVALVVAGLDVAAGLMFWVLYPRNTSLALTVVVNLAVAAAVTAWGALRQAQADLLTSYEERARRAEEQQAQREREIRQAERDRIAREMHDVVAHRISLVALHAGGLAVAPAPTEEDVRRAAGDIRSTAVQALDELRIAVGVLRADESRSLEQPGLDRVEDLVREATAAGQTVHLRTEADLAAPAPSGTGQAAYRIVQEGLTNARKHAPGTPVDVQVRHSTGHLVVVLTNPVVSASLGVPGSGTGLIGLQERASQVGGRLRHGLIGGGTFELWAELPWP